MWFMMKIPAFTEGKTPFYPNGESWPGWVTMIRKIRSGLPRINTGPF